MMRTSAAPLSWALLGVKLSLHSWMLESIAMRVHEGLVYAQCHKYKSEKTPFDDLAQVGFYGFIKALRRYKADSGCQISTYAVPFIRGEMLHYIRDRGRMIRLPQRVQQAMQLKAAQDRRGLTTDESQRLAKCDPALMQAAESAAQVLAYEDHHCGEAQADGAENDIDNSQTTDPAHSQQFLSKASRAFFGCSDSLRGDLDGLLTRQQVIKRDSKLLDQFLAMADSKRCRKKVICEHPEIARFISLEQISLFHPVMEAQGGNHSSDTTISGVESLKGIRHKRLRAGRTSSRKSPGQLPLL